MTVLFTVLVVTAKEYKPENQLSAGLGRIVGYLETDPLLKIQEHARVFVRLRAQCVRDRVRAA